MKRAVVTALSLVAVVGAFKLVQQKAQGMTWGTSAQQTLKDPLVWGVAAAGAVVGYLSR